MMKSVFWWRKPEYPEETTDLRQVTDETCVKQSELRRDESGTWAHRATALYFGGTYDARPIYMGQLEVMLFKKRCSWTSLFEELHNQILVQQT